MRILNTYYEDVPPSNVLTPEEILQLCCKPTSVDECSEVGRVTPYEGADQSDIDKDAALEQARADNPGKRILSVQIEDIGRPGKPCGEQHETWQDRLNCCDEVEPLSFDKEATPDVLPHDSSIIVYAASGIPPYTFRTTSHATSFPDGRRTWTTLYHFVELSAGETFCGGTQIEVTDGCSTAIMSVRSDLGRWEYDGIGCPLSGEPGVHIGDTTDSRIIELIRGNLKILDYQLFKTNSYYGLIKSGGGGLTGCPGPGHPTTCDGGLPGISDCACAAAMGEPLFVRDLCLAPNFDGITLTDDTPMCSSTSYMQWSGLLEYSCQDGAAFGSDYGLYRRWLGGGDGPFVYRWVC